MKNKYFLAISLLLIMAVMSACTPKPPDDEEPPAPEPPRHSCGATVFSKTLNRGASTTFELVLKPSAPDKEYRISASGYPRGVSGTLTEAAAGGDIIARVFLQVHPSAPTGSYTMAVVYEERNDAGEYIPELCKYNLIIE